MKYKLTSEFYKRINGRVEFLEFLNHLEKKDRAKLLAIIDKVATYTGVQQNWVKFIEIRSKVGKNQQRGLYFHVDGNHYVITHGFSKKTQKNSNP